MGVTMMPWVGLLVGVLCNVFLCANVRVANIVDIETSGFFPFRSKEVVNIQPVAFGKYFVPRG